MIILLFFCAAKLLFFFQLCKSIIFQEMKNAEIYNRCAFIVGIATKESFESEENHSIVRKREKPVMSKTFLICGFTPMSFISPLREEMIF